MACMHHKICTKFKMTNTSDVQTQREIEGVSINMPNTITDSSSDTIGGVPTTIEVKKRKIEAIYASGSWMDEDPYEITKVRQVIQNEVFNNLKFIKGYG